MDRRDRIKTKSLVHEELTGKVLGACFEVVCELGAGFLESVYEKALMVALLQRGFRLKRKSP
jgi:GxxExxY protein